MLAWIIAEGTSWIGPALGALVVGLIGGWVVKTFLDNQKRAGAKNEAESIIKEAENRKNEIVKSAEVEAKAEYLARQEKFEKEAAAERAELREEEKRLKKREDQLDQKLDMLGLKETNIEKAEARIKEQTVEIEKKSEEIDALLVTQRNELLKITNLNMDEAKRQLFTKLENELEHECSEIVSKAITEAQDEAEAKSRDIVITAVQRYAASHTSEATVGTVPIPNDELKGRVIGREGRNIRAFEKATGVDIIVDDTPGVIILSCFDPVRKEIGRQALTKLISDGRIHPTRIEEVVEEITKNVEKEVMEYGKKGAMEANVQGLHRRLIELLGKLHYRTSYGQNVLRHSIEVAYLCQIMADELGLNGTLARRCGLLHDIGKAVPQDTEGTHPQIGEEICRKLNERPEVLNAVAGHHGDVPSTSPYTPIVMAADAISAARPGSRRESLERYIKRLRELEDIATGFNGVKMAYAIQAGREVRVIVDANQVSDDSAMKIARDVAKKIEADMTYPGEIKVTLLREVRAVEYAR